MGRKIENYQIHKGILIDRLLRENSRLAHENVKLQNTVRDLNKKNKKLNKFIHKMMRSKDEEIFIIKNEVEENNMK